VLVLTRISPYYKTNVPEYSFNHGSDRKIRRVGIDGKMYLSYGATIAIGMRCTHSLVLALEHPASVLVQYPPPAPRMRLAIRSQAAHGVLVAWRKSLTLFSIGPPTVPWRKLSYIDA